jgi:transposase
MAQDTATTRTIGIDLGDRESTYVVLDEAGAVERTGKVRMTAAAIGAEFEGMGAALVALEVGTHSAWVSRLLEELGHEVVVANARQLPLISRSQKKNDRNDAETLARLVRMDRALLSPVTHRGKEAQEALALVHARDQLVQARTALINHVRGTVKAHGDRLPSCSAPAFTQTAWERIPEGLQAALLPLVETIAWYTTLIRRYDRQVEELCREVYPETAGLRQVTGVGALTALTFVLTLEDKDRFVRSRTVGAYLGLVPRQHESGALRPQLRITRAGDMYLRKLLVQCAHYILGPWGPDCRLRRWGLRLAGEGSVTRKKRALIAVARKLAVLLHRLWRDGEVYEPFHGMTEDAIAA